MHNQFNCVDSIGQSILIYRKVNSVKPAINPKNITKYFTFNLHILTITSDAIFSKQENKVSNSVSLSL